MAMAVALSEQTIESRSAARDSGACGSTSASDQGALTSRPTRGTMKRAAPHSARSASSAGGRSPRAPACGLDLREAVAGEDGLAGNTENEIDEGRPTPWIGAALDGRHRVGRDHVFDVRGV